MRPLPIPQNHFGSVSDEGSPLHLPRQFSRRGFMQLAGATAACGAIARMSPPIAAQSLTSTERSLLLHAIDVAMDAGADYADGRLIRTQFEAIRTREQTITQVQSHLLAHQYQGLIKKSKIRGR